MEDTLCPTTTSSSQAHYVPVAASLITLTAVAAALAITGAVVARKYIKKKRKKVYDRLSAQPHDDEKYLYDVFILCADEDEEFVMDFIENPLIELGYKTMRKNTAPDGLFALGNAIVSDIDHVIKLCSHVIVICSENYNSTRCVESDDITNHCSIELNYCKELISSCNGRVIPVILDGVGGSDFDEFTQHRVKTEEILSNRKARKTFIKKLERDISINR
jgi:hypothetical protein